MNPKDAFARIALPSSKTNPRVEESMKQLMESAPAAYPSEMESSFQRFTKKHTKKEVGAALRTAYVMSPHIWKVPNVAGAIIFAMTR